MEKKYGDEGFQNINFGGIQELIDITPQELIEDYFEVSSSKSLPDHKKV